MPEDFDMENLNLLIHLLDDPDQEAFQQVSNEILTIGLPAVEPLEEAWFNTNDNLARKRIEELVHSLQYDSLYSELEAWVASGGTDLLRGYMIATRFQYPNLEEEKLLVDLNKLTRSVWLELNDNLTSLEKIKVLNFQGRVNELFKFDGSMIISVKVFLENTSFQFKLKD